MTVPVIRCEKCGQGMRSYPQLKRFMKLVQVAYHHWPEGHDFHPACPEHLRAWLIVKAGFRTITPIRFVERLDSKAMDQVEAMFERFIKAAGAWVIIDVSRDQMLIQRPASMSYDKTPHDVATQICSAVDDVIFAELGVTSDTLLKEAEKAA